MMNELLKIKSPLVVEMEVTNNCNNRCIFCYNDTITQKSKYMSLENAIKIIDELKRNEVFGVTITGGECLLNKDLTKIIEYIKKQDMTVGIITNGILLENKITELSNLGLSHIQISLLGSNSKIHDNIVNHTGAFEKIINSIKKCNENNIKIFTNTPIVKQNVHDLESILKLALDLNVVGFSVTRYIHNSSNILDKCSVSLKEFNDTLRTLIKYKNKLNIKIANTVPLCSIEKDIDIINILDILTPCDCAKTWLTIDCEGNIFPCPSLRINCGSILNEGLKNIWDKNKVISNIKNDIYIKESCKSCEEFHICSGGCKSFSTYENGFISINDPYIKKEENLYVSC